MEAVVVCGTSCGSPYRLRLSFSLRNMSFPSLVDDQLCSVLAVAGLDMVVAVWLSQLVVEEVDRRTTGSRLEEKEGCYPIDAHSCNVESFQFGFGVAREKDRRLKTITPRPKVGVCRMCLSKGLGRRNKEHECSSCACHFIVSKVLSQWRKVGDRSRLAAPTTMYIIDFTLRSHSSHNTGVTTSYVSQH